MTQGRHCVLTILVTLFTIVVMLPVCASTKSDVDSGPVSSIAAVRHDLPILLSDTLSDGNGSLVIDWVLTDGQEAIAAWHSLRAGIADPHRGLVVLRMKSGRWWLRAAATSYDYLDNVDAWTQLTDSATPNLCGVGHPGPPSAHDLLSLGFIDASMAARASSTLRVKAPRHLRTVLSFTCDSFGDIGESSASQGYNAGFYHVEFPRNSFSLKGKGTDEEASSHCLEPATIYLFTLSSARREESTFTTGSTFSVRFPYVLDRTRRYALTLRDITPTVDSLVGKLNNNVLTFKLPKFTLSARSTAHGDIRSSPIN